MADGSFHMFRSRSQSNVWITAFALETLSDAVESDWHLFFIDNAILNKIARWLCARQNKTTGAWAEKLLWYDRKMVDPRNMTDANGKSLNLTLTAYVTASLSKSRRVLTWEAASQTRTAITLGADYLARHLPLLWEPFQICIVAYALNLANHNAKNLAFEMVRRSNMSGEYLYWSADEIPGNRYEIIYTIQYLYPRLEHPIAKRAKPCRQHLTP